MHRYFLPNLALASISLLHVSAAASAMQASRALASLSLEQLSAIQILSELPYPALSGYHEFGHPLIRRVWPELNRALAGHSLSGAVPVGPGVAPAHSHIEPAVITGTASRI